MKPTDDETWTEVEQGFFAAAPPEEPEPPGEPPSVDDLPALPQQRPWRRATLVLAAAGGHVQRAWRKTALVVGAASADRRYVALALAGAIVAAGLTAGGIASRTGTLTKGAGGPTIVEAAPVVAPARPATPRPNVVSSADAQAPRAVAANRRPHDRRRYPMVTAPMDRETYWAIESRSAPARSSRPLFSR